MLKIRAICTVRRIHLVLISIFVLSIAVSSVRLNILYFINIIKHNPSISGKQDIIFFDRRFSLVKSFLPPGSVVGYISDSYKSDNMDYFLTQFALNPLIISNKSNNEIFIGNFRSVNYRNICLNNGFEIIKDFGGGVILLRKKSQ
ncbi:MAG: hypothetical protein A2287_06765 [Candidatus Melainabacteria bacterium RIFOXYA12_FULL_32_12]|nr:MAG: hypothetical protein A2287_06765 [Candidatus Melainabacteria bacterium RIFOXYA12_FULL_32_12]